MAAVDIGAAARTVLRIAAQLDALGDRCEALAARTPVAVQGYFKPAEDEETRHLLVSYWHTRSAMRELIEELGARSAAPDEVSPARFLVIFAGALALVAAARYLRDAFERQPVIRRQLNEPDPAFGVPPRAYDRIQRSLTDPATVYRLWQARRHFDDHAAQLATAVADDETLSQVFLLVDRHIARLRTPVSRYARARLRVDRRRVIGTLGRGGFQALYQIQRVAASVVADRYLKPQHRPGVPPHVRAALLEALRPGDVIVVRKHHAVTNYFLPGFWPHAALYVGRVQDLAELGVVEEPALAHCWSRMQGREDGEPRRVLEAKKDGVWLRSVHSALASDSVVLLRPRLEPAQLATALRRGLAHEGKAYDFDFDFTRSDRLVCSEVVYRTYDGIGPVAFTLEKRAGRWTLAAEDIVRLALAGRGFETAAIYAPEFHPQVAEGEEARAIVRATLASVGSEAGT